MVARKALAILAGAALLLTAAPASAGKKQGENGSGVVAPITGDGAGPHDRTIPPDQASPSLGNVLVTATMMAGAGAGKCRMNFVMYNQASAAIAMGALASAINAKGELTDNWVINIGMLPPNGQTARLFSCGLGAAKLIFTPLPAFNWPPVKCAKPDQDPDICAVGLRIESTLPLGEKSDIKQTAPEPPKEH